ncbi:hypothetical protein [Persicitalea sp.]|uniref:hypothetical protein n=1 Tax=Persicitalea sp. TaxID=3100273 RepID=UPI003593DB7F
MKEYSDWTRPEVSPEWELFRSVQQMSWDDLATNANRCLLDMYRSTELGLDLQKALSSPKLNQLGEKHGKDLVCRLIALTVLVYFDRLPKNTEANFGTWRLRQTAEWLYDTYSCESLRDLMYAFRRAQGYYAHDLLEVMTNYLEWRAGKLEAIHQARSQAVASPWPNNFKEKLPQRWFLGYQNSANGSNSQEAA